MGIKENNLDKKENRIGTLNAFIQHLFHIDNKGNRGKNAAQELRYPERGQRTGTV